MSLNYLEIEEAIKDFPKQGILKKVFQNDKNTILLNIYDGKTDFLILASIKDNFNRICIVPENISIEKNNLRFSQFLNSTISGMRIINFYQFNKSRIVVLDFIFNNEMKKLVFRLWNTAGNILLLDNKNNIIECMRRFPKRNEWPDEQFIFPENKSIDLKFEIRNEFKAQNINESIFNFYNEILNIQEFTNKKNLLLRLLNKELSELNKKIKSNNGNLIEEKENIYLHYGELIKANIYKINKGEKSVDIKNYNNKNITIELLPTLSAVDNAKRYFEKYKKIKNGKIKWEVEKIKFKNKLENINHLISVLNEINNLNRLNIFEEEIIKNLTKKIHNKTDDMYTKVRSFVLDGGYTAYISKSAKDSFDMLNKYANGNDYWFHIRDYPGSHVIVKKIKKEELSERVKIEASNLAVYFSKKRNSLDADVYFTLVKYLHKSKGGPQGLVFPTQEKNIKVKVDKELLNKIFAR